MPFTPDSPLLVALRQHQQAPSKATADIRDALMVGWTLQRTEKALGLQLPASQQQLMAEFLASRQSVTLAPFLRGSEGYRPLRF